MFLGGKDCKVRSILRPNEVKATEKFATREAKFHGKIKNINK